MQLFTLKPGLCIIREDHHYRLMRYGIKGEPIFQDENGETWCVSAKELLRLYDRREVLIPAIQPVLGVLPVKRIANPDLSCYPKAHAEAAMRRRRILELVMDGEQQLPPDSELRERLRSATEELQDTLPCPSTSTVRRWLQAFRAAGGWAIGLLPAHRNKGRKRVIHGELEDVIKDALHELWLIREPAPIRQVHLEIGQRIKEINQYRVRSKWLPAPSQATLYRYLNDLDPEYVYTAQKGVHAARRKFRSAIGMVNAKNINSRWEIDHTPLDVLVIDEETGEVIGRPWLTIVIDRESRMVMGYVLHLLAPTMETVLHAIERAIRPKGNLLARYPSLHQDWPCCGFPLRIVPDNGAEFHAKGLISSFAEMGIEVLFPPSRSPKHKAVVERFFRTLAEDLIHTLPGTTFSNTRERDDYPSEEMACFTMSALEKILVRWIVDVYHCKPHKSLRQKSPLSRWNELQSKRSIHLPRDLDDLEVMLSSRRARVVHHYGVELSGIRYNSEELQRIAHRAGQGDRVEVRHRDELGHVWIKDPEDEVFLQVPAIDSQYIGLSRDIYEAAIAQERRMGNRDLSFESVISAYRAIRHDTQEAKKSQRMRGRRNAAAVSIDRSGAVRPELPQPIPEPIQTMLPGFDLLAAEVPVFTVTPMTP